MGILDELLPIREVLVDGQTVPYAPLLDFPGATVELVEHATDPLQNKLQVTLPIVDLVEEDFDGVANMNASGKSTFSSGGECAIGLSAQPYTAGTERQ